MVRVKNENKQLPLISKYNKGSIDTACNNSSDRIYFTVQALNNDFSLLNCKKIVHN